MLSLLENINHLENWHYYKNDAQCPMINWNDNTENIKFIHDFLKLSAKENIIDHFKIHQNFERATHTNSVFFMGCLFYEKLNLESKIKFIGDERDEFHFIWFLTSLMHDFGYDIEENKQDYESITNDIESVKRYFQIEEDLLLQVCHSCSENTKKVIAEIKDYYKARFDGKIGRTKEGKIDHGIISGLILYDWLVKNRKKKVEEYDIEDKLYWGEDLDLHYSNASYSIAVHNLRSSENLKFSIENEGFLFLLMLIDTIEPTKCFASCDSHYVLENIIIEFHDGKNGFTIKNREGSKLNFSIYEKNINRLENFLKIKIDKCHDNKYTISWQFE